MRILINGGRGFVGSVLSEYLSHGGHEVASLDVSGIRDDEINYLMDYRDLGAPHLQHDENAVDVVIHLAGHSSVAACEADPWGSVENNVTDFLPFVKMLAGLKKPPLLMWASSGSVLSDVHSLYDEQKRALEALVPALYPNSVRLRFGSVCGASPNPRHDIILNAMVKSAVETGTIKVANRNIRKPVLGLKDLSRAIESLLRAIDGVDDDQYPNALDGLCSFVTTPMKAASAVAFATGAKIIEMPDSRAYDFTMRPWRLANETLDSIVADLVEFYRARLDAEARHRV